MYFRAFLSDAESDASKSHIRIARSEMDNLGIKQGNIVKITGQKTTKAICLPQAEKSTNKPQTIFLNDSGKDVPEILVSDITLSNLQLFSGVGSQVKLEKTDIFSTDNLSATKVVVAKLSGHTQMLGDDDDYQNKIKFEKLQGRLISKNDRIVIPVGENDPRTFSSIILDVQPESPHQVWLVTQDTKFEFQDVSIDVFRQDMPSSSGLKNLKSVIPITKQIPIDEDITMTIPSLEIYENGSKLRIYLTERLHKIEEVEKFDFHTKKHIKVKQPAQKLDGFPRFNITIHDDMENLCFGVPGGGGGSGSSFPSDDPNWEFYQTYDTTVSFLPPSSGSKGLTTTVFTGSLCPVDFLRMPETYTTFLNHACPVRVQNENSTFFNNCSYGAITSLYDDE